MRVRVKGGGGGEGEGARCKVRVKGKGELIQATRLGARATSQQPPAPICRVSAPICKISAPICRISVRVVGMGGTKEPSPLEDGEGARGRVHGGHQQGEAERHLGEGEG